ncbi:M23 family metallopeptidase [Candidatus Gracilibacteria bacterium]|nr:M23 family metallopeptidase [Candidatus Gracilibacteria bacterium]
MNNQVVTANTYLGDISIQSGCGGSASGPHVHFSTRINGSYQDIEGLNFSGWGFSEGNNNYEGCVSNGTITNCLPGTVSYNVNYTNGCNPPISGDWNITSSCDFVGAATAPANVIVNNNSTLRIKNGASLNINMTSNKIVAKPGSRLIIESGGKVY